VLAFGAAPVKTAVLAGSNPAGTCDLSEGRNMINATGFLLGFVTACTPISIYVAWVSRELLKRCDRPRDRPANHDWKGGAIYAMKAKWLSP
jgi:hypothetical protein